MVLITAGSGCGVGGSGGVTAGGMGISGPTGLMAAAFGLLALFAVWVAWRRSAPAGGSPESAADGAEPVCTLADRTAEPLGSEWYVPSGFVDEAGADRAPCPAAPGGREHELV